MPKSTNLEKYPRGMIEVLESVCLTGTPCDIEYPDRAAAERERFDFYGLIRALKVNDHTLKSKVGLLRLSISGPDKNKLTITLGNPIKNDFYSQIADSHRAKAPAGGPTLEELAVAALTKQQQEQQ